MSGFTPAVAASLLDTEFVGTDYIGYSTNGSSETGGLARTAIKPGATGWSNAVSGSPSTKANGAALTSAGASSAITITHIAVFSASTGGTQKTDWIPVSTPRSIGSGEQVTVGIGDIVLSLE